MNKLIITTPPELEDLIFSSLKRAFGEIKTEKPGNDQRFLNLAEASEFLNLASQTIYTLTSKREIPFLKKGKKLYFKEADLIAWLEKGRKDSVDELKQQSTGLTLKRKGGRND
jgi:excisionase family DNA binding protein